jgi:alkanesulfonate monooxygenase SsuD/methylene tetrahydromethanopterin reductase-like flavin-dependent oxidoreductase (luciferase family)
MPAGVRRERTFLYGAELNKPTFGVLHDFRQPQPHRQSDSAYYAECIAEIEEADRLGFECVWLSEHHGVADGFLPSPLVVAAALAARTTRIGLGTNILVLPLHHPLRIAEDGAVIDLISNGRFVLGVGQGYAANEFATFGLERRSRASRLEEGIQIIRRAWEDGRTGFEGKHWRIPDGPFAPRPERLIPILVGAVSERAVDRAVRLADGLIVYCGTPADLPARARLLGRTLDRHGRPRETFRFVAGGILHIDEDAERGWREAAAGIEYLEGQLAHQAARDGPASATGPPLHREDYLVGEPEKVAAGLIDLYRAVGFDHFAAWARLPGIAHERALSSLRLLAEQVIPSVDHAIRQQLESD